MEIQDIIGIKQASVKKIVDCIRFKDTLTKKDISNMTELSFSTVSNICNELKEKGFIKEIPLGSNGVGRTPKIISLNYDQYYILSLDFHIKDTIIISFLDLRNRVLAKYEHEIKEYKDLEEYISYSYTLFKKYCGILSIPPENIIGAGVAVSGIFDKDNETIVGSEVEIFENQPLKKMLREAYNIPVYIDNESNLCVMSTCLHEHQKHERDNIIYVYITEGVGVGIITQGNLLSGEKGYGAEICHIPLGNSKYQCRLCKSYGCIETDLAIYGFIGKYTGEYGYDKEEIFKQWHSFVELVKRKDAKAMEVIRENGVILGRLLSILVNIFDPGIIYVGGMIVSIFDDLCSFMKPEIDNRMVVKHRTVEVKADEKWSQAIMEGIGEMVFAKWMPLRSTI
jgi:predicted NBD/HSP70 family sugar kinase